MLDSLKQFDVRLFLFLNARHNSFFDGVMYYASDQLFWIPLYVFLLVYMLVRLGKIALYYAAAILLMEVASDQLSSNLIKNIVKRPRPSHEPALAAYIHLSKAGPGGHYGFVSGHACNSFALASFLCLTLPPGHKYVKIGAVAWALLVSYSRIYNGVHYPGDVVCAAILGTLLGALFSWAALRFQAVRSAFDRGIITK